MELHSRSFKRLNNKNVVSKSAILWRLEYERHMTPKRLCGSANPSAYGPLRVHHHDIADFEPLERPP